MSTQKQIAANRLSLADERPAEPSQNGFVFSNPEILTAARHPEK